METVVGIVVIIAGLVAMQAYLQRAMQGNLFATSQSFGTQFDPRDVYDERPSINITDTITLQPQYGMVEAMLIEPDPPTNCSVCQHVWPILAEHPDWYLSSLPTGPVPREPGAYAGYQVTSEWSTGGSLTHDDQR